MLWREAHWGPGSAYWDVGRLAVPAVKSSSLGNIVRDLYKGATRPNPIGNGSTMDAIRWEAITGLPLGGKFHGKKGGKGDQYANALRNWLKDNPNAEGRDILIAESLLADLMDALAAAK